MKHSGDMMYKIAIFILLLSVNIAFSIENNNDTTRIYMTGEVMVTDRKQPVIATSSVRTIDNKTIEKIYAVNVNDAFKFIPGIFFRTNLRNESAFSIRGFDQRQVAFLIDGVPVYDSFSGSLDLSQLSILPAEKITISKGTSSFLYGINTMGGAINLVSKEIYVGTRANADVFYGRNLKGAIASHSGASGFFFWSLGGSFTSSDGYVLPDSFHSTRFEDGGLRDQSDYEKLGLFVKAGIRSEKAGTLMLSAFNFDNSGSFPLYTDSTDRPRYWKMPQWRKTILNMVYNNTFFGGLGLNSNIYYQSSGSILDSYDDSTYSSQTKRTSFHTTYNDLSYGINFIINIMPELFQDLNFGFHYKKDQHREQDNYNLPYDEFTADNFSASIEEGYSLDNFIFSAGLGYDIMRPSTLTGNISRPEMNNFKWRIGTAWLPVSRIKLHFSISENGRFPTLKELYADLAVGGYIANPELLSEKSMNLEAGFSFMPDTIFSYNFTIFNNSVKNLIQPVTLAQTRRQYRNIGEAVFQGFEAEMQMHFFYIDLLLNYTYMYSENRTDNAISKFLEFKPRHLLNTFFRVGSSIGLSLQLETSTVATQFAFEPVSRVWEKMKDYMLINMGFSQVFYDHYEVYVRVNNTLDILYESEPGFPQPGINYMLGLKLFWD